jgi:hypothetical protein
MKKLISVIAACVGALLLAAGIALPSASADPTNAPSPKTCYSTSCCYLTYSGQQQQDCLAAVGQSHSYG